MQVCFHIWLFCFLQNQQQRKRCLTECILILGTIYSIIYITQIVTLVNNNGRAVENKSFSTRGKDQVAENLGLKSDNLCYIILIPCGIYNYCKIIFIYISLRVNTCNSVFIIIWISSDILTPVYRLQVVYLFHLIELNWCCWQMNSNGNNIIINIKCIITRLLCLQIIYYLLNQVNTHHE